MVGRSQESFDRFSRLVDGPLMVLALLMIPLLIVPSVMELSEAASSAITAADYFIWAVFAIEYVTKLYLAPHRWRFVKGHVPDLVIVALPLLRPLRVLRSMRLLRMLRLIRVVAVAIKGLSLARAVLGRKGLNYVLLVVLAIVALGAILVREFERGMDGSNIASLPDAIWWALVTVTTVGYGDRFPVTSGGRGVAVVLMLSGIAVFGALTASIAAYFVEQSEQPSEVAELSGKLDTVLARLESIESKLPQGAEEFADP